MTPWRFRSWFTGSPDPEPARIRRLRAAVRTFRRACEQRSVDEIAALLARDARLLVDSDGAVPAALSDVRGSVPISASVVGLLSLFPECVFREEEVNGMPALALRSGDRVVGVITMAVRRHAIVSIWAVVNPDKLAGWNR